MSIETALRTQERIAELVENLDTIATLPEVTTRITAAVNDPKSTANDLYHIVSHDPALVSRLLKLVNSSFCGLRSRVDSVQRAIVMLGFDAVRNVAVTATLGQIFKHVNLCDDYTARDLWTHCVAVATASREIARQVCKPMAEQAFLAGLIHDVGLLVELQACPWKLNEVCHAAQSNLAPFCMLELDTIGCNHAELGAALAARWGFPDYCRAVAAYHHHPAMAEPEYRQLVAVIYAADTLCCQDSIGFDLTAKDQMAEVVGFEGLVPLEVIQSTRENLPEIVSDAILVFSA